MNTVSTNEVIMSEFVDKLTDIFEKQCNRMFNMDYSISDDMVSTTRSLSVILNAPSVEECKRRAANVATPYVYRNVFN